MLGFLVESALGFLLRFWTIGVLFFFRNRFSLWLKGINSSKITYNKLAPTVEHYHHNKKASSLSTSIRKSSPNSWNCFILSGLAGSKKLSFPWVQKTLLLPRQMSVHVPVLDNQAEKCLLSHELFPWNLDSVSGTATEINKNFKTPAMFSDMLDISQSIKPCHKTKDSQDVYIDYCETMLQEEKVYKMEAVESLYGNEKHCRSAGSIDSGFQSFHSSGSAYTRIEEEGVTLYVSNCRYNGEGKLIFMVIGFGVLEESSSGDSLGFDDELSDSDSICSESEEEDFIVFDAGSCHDDTKECCLDQFVFEGTADEISIAMTLRTPTCPTWELTINTVPQTSSYNFCLAESELAKDCKYQTGKISANDDDNVYDIEDNDNSSIGTVNIYEQNSAGAVCTSKKQVKFKTDVEVHMILAWDFAYRESRKSEWKEYAINRQHFKRRIDEAAAVIKPVLEKKITQITNNIYQ